jgi:hypothetical protein
MLPKVRKCSVSQVRLKVNVDLFAVRKTWDKKLLLSAWIPGIGAEIAVILYRYLKIS